MRARSNLSVVEMIEIATDGKKGESFLSTEVRSWHGAETKGFVIFAVLQEIPYSLQCVNGKKPVKTAPSCVWLYSVVEHSPGTIGTTALPHHLLCAAHIGTISCAQSEPQP